MGETDIQVTYCLHYRWFVLADSRILHFYKCIIFLDFVVIFSQIFASFLHVPLYLRFRLEYCALRKWLLRFFVNMHPNRFNFFPICWQFKLHRFCCLHFFKLLLFLLGLFFFRTISAAEVKAFWIFPKKSSMWEIFLLFALIVEFVTFFSSWLSLLSSVFIPSVLWLFFFYVTCLSSVWFLSEWVEFGLRLESLRNMGQWSDKWFKSSRYTGKRYWIQRDTESNLIVKSRFQMLTISSLYCTFYFLSMLYVLEDLP